MTNIYETILYTAKYHGKLIFYYHDYCSILDIIHLPYGIGHMIHV